MRSTDTRPAGVARVAGPPWLNRIDWLLLFLVLAVAIFFRLWQQGQVPPGMNFDEAFESLEARRLLAEPGYRPVYFTGNWGIPPLEIYLTALAFLIAGEHMHAIRYVSAVAGIITIVPLYVLTRMLFPLPSATGMSDDLPAEWGASLIVRRFLPFVASLIMAVLPWHNAFSREGVEVVLVPLWTILAVLFLWRGLQTTQMVAVRRIRVLLGQRILHLSGGMGAAWRTCVVRHLQNLPGEGLPPPLWLAASVVGVDCCVGCPAVGAIRHPEPVGVRHAH